MLKTTFSNIFVESAKQVKSGNSLSVIDKETNFKHMFYLPNKINKTVKVGALIAGEGFWTYWTWKNSENKEVICKKVVITKLDQ